MKHSNAQELWEKDKHHFTHPYANMNSFNEEGSTIFTKGERHFIYDAQGRKYIDGIAGLWCVNIGHGRKDIADFMANQAKNLAYYNTFGGASSPAAAELAAKLASICPGDLNHVFYGTGGSVANDTAIKLVHYYFNMLGKTSKKLVISRDLAYHGSTYLAHTLTGIKSTHIGFDTAKNLVHYITAPYAYRNKEEGLTEEEFCDDLIAEFEHKILELGPDNIACFIAEPIMGAGGVIVPPKGYHKRTYEICKKYDMLYISDEVVTAFGRLGHLVTSKDVFDIIPDILVMAKGLSSGYVPLGATIYSDTIHEVISRPKAENPYLSHGFTYSGHALCCAVGLKNIDILEHEGFCEHVMQWGNYFEEALKTLENIDIVGETRGSKFMLSIEYVKNKITKELFDDDVDIGSQVYEKCKSRGLIIRPIGALNVLSPPLTYDKEAIDTTVSILRDSIIETMSDLKY